MTDQLTRPLVCPVLVGRAAERSALVGVLDGIASARGATVLLSGEAGIGKSRLARALAEEAAARGCRVLEARCYEQERTLAYAPILDLLRALIPAASPSTKARLGAGAAVIRTLLPGIRGLDAGDEGDESLEPELQRRQLFDGVLAAILGEASEFPALLLVEDVHWADQASLDWIAFLSRMTASNPLLLLLTYRSDDVSPGLAHLLATLDRERLAFEVELRPLGMGDVEAMVGATLGDASPLRADMLESLHRRSGGNPFLVEELLRSVTGGRPLEAGQVASASIPRSFDEALSARLAALSGEARELLNAAAVIGDRLDIDLLAAARRSTADELIPGLRELALQQLLVEDGDGWFRFRHALTRDAVLARLLSTERRREHARVAEALARVEGAASERAPELAYHRFEAGDWAAVVEPARIAGERARLAGAPAAAVAHFDRAVVAAEHSGHAPPDLLLGRAHAYDALGAFDEARADFEAAADAALAADDAHAQEEAALGLALLWSSRDYGRARGYTERAVEIARRIGNPAAVARALNRAANWYSNAGGYETSRSYLDEALEAARASGDERVLAETLDLLGMTCLVGARLDEGLGLLLEAAAIFTRLGDPRAASSPLASVPVFAGTYQTSMLEPALPLPEAIIQGEEAVVAARASRAPSAVAYALWQLGYALGPRGEHARALSVTREALAIAERIGHRQWTIAARCVLGALAVDLLDADEAIRILSPARDEALTLNSAIWVGQGTATLGDALLLDGRVDEARALLEDDTSELPAGLSLLAALRATLAIEVALADGRAEIAHELIDRYFPGPRAVRAVHMRARADLLSGRPHEAAAGFESCVALARAQGDASFEWRALADLASVRAAGGDSAGARAAADEALACISGIASGLAEVGVRERFAAKAALRLPPRLRRRAQPGAELLSPREWEVARLVARGLGNQAIADELVLGVRTVETHVAHAMSKTGQGSRAGLASWVTARVAPDAP